MQHHLEYQNSVAVITLKGNLTGGDETDVLEHMMADLFSSGEKQILLDLKNTQFITSRALKVLERLHRHAGKLGAILRLCNVDKRNEEVFAIFWLTRVLNVVSNREEAFKAFSKV